MKWLDMAVSLVPKMVLGTQSPREAGADVQAPYRFPHTVQAGNLRHALRTWHRHVFRLCGPGSKAKTFMCAGSPPEHES